MLMRFTGPKGFFKSTRLSQAWRLALTKSESAHKNKQLNNLMKEYCFGAWPAHLCGATRKYLEGFHSFNNMLQYRPKVRFDGIYMCKLIYYRKGLSETSDLNPIHEVISYRYIRFNRWGGTTST